jgi:NADP-dependent 3-hydroxy acid dehydrogenase YdfG
MKITEDMVVFITGGSSGLGEAAARLLHSLGCKIAITGQNVKKMEQMKAELKDRFIYLKCDVSIESQVKSAIQTTIDTFGTIHVVLPAMEIFAFDSIVTEQGSINIE